MNEVSEETDENVSAMQFPDDCPLHRALLRSGLYDKVTGSPLPSAFLRRRDDYGNLKEDSLSVADARNRTSCEFAGTFRRCHGVAEIRVNSVRAIGLDAKSDPNSNDVYHALIYGQPDDITEEEHLAIKLARSAEIVKSS